MRRRIRLPLVLCTMMFGAGLATAGATAGAAPSAHAAKACGSASPTTLRGGYYLGLTVKGVGCATGRKVQAGWQSCRLKHGAGGRCTSKVSGFTCHELRQSIPTQVTAKVSCKRSRSTVAWTYQQNLV